MTMVLAIPVLLILVALVGGLFYLLAGLFTKNDGASSSGDFNAPTLDTQPGPSAPAETDSEKETTL